MRIHDIPIPILGIVRQRMGAEDKEDTSKDKLIEELTPVELVRKVSGWELGCEHWAGRYISMYEQLREIGAKEKEQK